MDNIEKQIQKEIERIEENIISLESKIHDVKNIWDTLTLIESLDVQKWRLEQFIDDLGKY